MELTVFKDYNEYHNEVSGVLNRTVEDFVYTGYLLKQGRDTNILNTSWMLPRYPGISGSTTSFQRVGIPHASRHNTRDLAMRNWR